MKSSIETEQKKKKLLGEVTYSKQNSSRETRLTRGPRKATEKNYYPSNTYVERETK